MLQLGHGLLEVGKDRTRIKQIPLVRGGLGTNSMGHVGRGVPLGRIGEDPRGERLRECANRDEALRLAAAVIELRLRHGYAVKC